MGGPALSEAERRAVFLTGPIGSGKTTLGRALANALDAEHVEGDDFQRPPRPWYATSLSTSRAILAEALRRLDKRPIVLISYPLRCHEWIFFQRHLEKFQVVTRFVALAASYGAVASPSRGRTLDESEKRRVREMLAQGYDRPRFADLIVRTDLDSAEETLSRLLKDLAAITVGRSG